nr:hypothetical protein [Micromonospora sp. 4G51]
MTYNVTQTASVSLDSLDDEVPPDAVEELLNVKIDHPVFLPTPLPATLDRIQSRPIRPVTVGILVEYWIHPDPQVPGYHRLRDPVGDGGDAEHPRAAAVLFRNLHRSHRRRKIRPRRHPIPDLVKVVFQIGLEVGDGLPVHPRRTLIALHLTKRLPDLPLRNLKRLRW